MELVMRKIEMERLSYLKEVFPERDIPNIEKKNILCIQDFTDVFLNNEKNRFVDAENFLRTYHDTHEEFNTLRTLNNLQKIRMSGRMLSTSVSAMFEIVGRCYMRLFNDSENMDIKIRCSQYLVNSLHTDRVSRDIVERWCFENVEYRKFDILEILASSSETTTRTRALELLNENRYQYDAYKRVRDLNSIVPVAQNKSVNRRKVMRTIYSDSQNVHESSVNNSILEVIEKWKPFFVQLVTGNGDPTEENIGDLYLDSGKGNVWAWKEKKWVLVTVVEKENVYEYKWLKSKEPGNGDVKVVWVSCKNLPIISVHVFDGTWKIEDLDIEYTSLSSHDYEEIIVKEIRNLGLYDDTIETVLRRIYTDTGLYGNKSMEDILNQVWFKILHIKDKKELVKRFVEECYDMHHLCSTGHLSRLVNVLSGFDPDVSINIGDKCQMAAALKTRFYKKIEMDDDAETLVLEICDADSQIIKVFKEKCKQSLYDELVKDYGDVDVRLFDDLYQKI